MEQFQPQPERISFEELRALKDSLPHGAIDRIAQELGLDPQQVRDVFAAQPALCPAPECAFHVEKTPAGAYILLQNNRILLAARKIANGKGNGKFEINEEFIKIGQFLQIELNSPELLRVALRGPITPEAIQAVQSALAMATEAGQALALRIASSGGSVQGLRHLARTLRESQRFAYALIDGRCHSAAFWIASQARCLIALQREATAGSVGVMIRYLNPDGALRQQGVSVEDLYSDLSPRKNLPMRDAAQGQFDTLKREMLDPLAQQFIDDVLAARGARIAAPHGPEVRALLEGEYATAEELLARGFIDGICEDPEQLRALTDDAVRSTLRGLLTGRKATNHTGMQAEMPTVEVLALDQSVPQVGAEPPEGAMQSVEPTTPPVGLTEGAGAIPPGTEPHAGAEAGMGALMARFDAICAQLEALLLRAESAPKPAPKTPADGGYEPGPTAEATLVPPSRAEIRAQLRAAESLRLTQINS